jgi:DNA-binding transcriptional MerR regulator
MFFKDGYMYPINVVEKETKISKYLLRMWERRYSFPRPQRDAKGERVYTDLDVEKLKLVKSLMEEGYRPSKIIDQSLEDLKILRKNFKGSDKQVLKDRIVILVTNKDLMPELQKFLEDGGHSHSFVVNNSEDLKNLTI